MIHLNHKLYNVPGILLSVGEQNNKISHLTSGFSDVLAATPMDAKGLFRCGLVTRLFTMGIVMRLVDDRAFDLDSPLEWVAANHQQDRGLLNILVAQYPILKPVTVRQLLNNTSGLPAFDKTLAYNQIFIAKPRKIWQLENYLDAISGAEVKYQHGYQAGTRGYFSDSGTNYILAGLVIEAVSGIKTSEAMRNLFREFGLNDTYYLSHGVLEEALISRMIHGYLPVSHPYAQAFVNLPQITYNENRELAVVDVTSAYTAVGMGNAAALSTTTDLIRWFKQLINAKVVTANYKQVFKDVPIKTFISESKDSYCLGLYKSIFKEYGEILWTAGNSLGCGVLLAHVVGRDLTFALVANASREHFSLHAEGLVAEVMTKLLT